MGLELYITRAVDWASNDDCPISAEEWLNYVNSDTELSIDKNNGDYFAVWSGKSAHEVAWLDWSQGNISTKWPDTALYQKMLLIAKALSAHVQDDEGTRYPEESDWQYDPQS